MLAANVDGGLHEPALLYRKMPNVAHHCSEQWEAAPTVVDVCNGSGVIKAWAHALAEGDL